MRSKVPFFAEKRAEWVWLRLAMLLAVGMVGAGRAQAPLALPSAIVFDAQGNLYVAETGYHVVRRFSPSGTITTIAGTGVQGFGGDGGLATAAELDSPGGLALDAAGNLFITDTHNHRVRKVAPSGTISTVVGNGVAGFSGDGGLATAARVDSPTALAFDSAGNLYLADTGNHRVRRLAAVTGFISSVAGNGIEGFAGDGGLAIAASIDSPNGLALDAAGNLYIADTHNHRLREVSAATGLISTIAGTGAGQKFGGDGDAATVAGLALPRGLTMDAAGNLYVADAGNQRVRRISAAGTITTVAGQGTEALAGDGEPAVSASLDSPRAVAISPAGLLTLADSDNRRVRQLDASPAPHIHTIAGGADIADETLMLTGPVIAAYGSSTLTATLGGGANATGSVTFVDLATGRAVPLGAAALNGNSAAFSLSSLGVGAHTIVGIYAGDTSHASTQSSAWALMVTPLSINAMANPTAILFGQAVPPLGGTLSGVLVQDAGKVSPIYVSSAGASSAVGVYPMAVSLTGLAAGNYTIGSVSGSVTISKAPVVVTITSSASTLAVGAAVTLNVLATSTTSGIPTGNVTWMDGSAILATVPLSAGSATYSTSALGVGAHSCTAAYAGDSSFLASTSVATLVTIGAGADFTLAATGATSLSVPGGTAATFAFKVAMQGTPLSSPITLAVHGVPLGATASLSPAMLPAGGAVTNFTLTIQTPLAELNRPTRSASHGSSTALALIMVPLFGALSRKKFRGKRLVTLLAVFGSMFTSGCGDRTNTAPETANAKTYTLTVTATATSPTGTVLQHSVGVTLQVL